MEYSRRAGTGPKIVFLHGIGSNAHSFEATMEDFPEPFDVIAWNAPGYSSSGPFQAAWPDAFDYAERLVDFLDFLGIQVCHLIGHSLGTLMAAAFAAKYPQRVDTLVLAACAIGYGSEPGGELPEKAAARIDALIAEGPEKFAAKRAPRLIYDAENNPELVSRVYDTMSKVKMPGYLHAVQMLSCSKLDEILRKVKTSTSFLVGAQDVVTPPSQTAAAFDARNQSTGFVAEPVQFADAGHALYLQKQDKFIRAIERILSREVQP
ncbi:hypothetical protein TH25_24920 [Thalassospira profundimaris]|uniref:AB hydrolase-1 domain-containing protein n=1 Tax=Thalassospira profundimaris TaxID=502049 RepID=A0A367WFL3_9PROT|nr:hypothetical protein TH25_24920 [Thalassospira profundimaris]